MIAEYEKVVALLVVRKLAAYGFMSKRHCKKETLLSGIASDKRKIAEEILEGFIRKGWLARHPTAHGMNYELTRAGAENFLPILEEFKEKKRIEFGI